jgi:serine protease AprX
MGVCSKMDFPLLACRMRWMSAAAASGVLVLAVIVSMNVVTAQDFSVSPSAGEVAAQDKVGSTLTALAADRPEKRAEVIVRMQPGQSPEAGRRLVEHAGGKAISRNVPIINGFGARLDAGDAVRVAEDPRVLAVSLNGTMQTENALLDGEDVGGDAFDGGAAVCPPADATASDVHYPIPWRNNEDTDIETAVSYLEGAHHHSISAEKAWDRATGRGVGVAVVDTGIAGGLPDFRRHAFTTSSRVVASAVTNPCATEATDNYGHGTHVAGLIAGNSLNLHEKDPNYGAHMGIAPEANLINVKVADEDGRATVLDVIHGLQFVVDHKDTYNIRVVNLSLASTVAESYKTDPLDAAAEQAWLQGVVVVTAAGNEGTAEDAVSYAPGNDPFVISVGALDDRGTRSNDDDRLADWSSRGVTQDGFRKPEVLAPGSHLVAPVAPSSDLTAMCPTCMRDGRYFRMGGTSMSAAVVSGVAALIVQRRPDWTPNQVKGAVMSTLDDVRGAGGEVDAYRSMYAQSLRSNVGLEPNELIDPATGAIDHLRASFRRASFRSVDGDGLDASWSRASFRCDCSLLEGGAIDPARASFRRASFRKLIGFGK